MVSGEISKQGQTINAPQNHGGCPNDGWCANDGCCATNDTTNIMVSPTVRTTTSITCMPTGAREKHARTERRGLMSWCASADDSLRTAIATKIRQLLRVLKRLQRLMSRDIAALHYDRRCYDLLCDDRGTRDHKSYYSGYDC